MWGLLYDVHGNLPALEAVLADARDLPVEHWLLGGDYALFGGWPNETVDLLETLTPATWIRGNGERWTAVPEEAPPDATVQGAIASAFALLGPDRVAFLAALPESAALGEHTRAWHASPVSDERSFLPEPQPEDAELLGDTTERRLIFGHTHLPFSASDAGGGRAGEPRERRHAVRRQPARGLRAAPRRRDDRAPARALRPRVGGAARARGRR